MEGRREVACHFSSAVSQPREQDDLSQIWQFFHQKFFFPCQYGFSSCHV